MEANVKVRIKGDPTRIGRTTGKTRLQRERLLIQVQFPDLPQYIPEDQLEPVPDRETPLDLLLSGRFGRTIDLRRTITHVRLSGRLADVIYSMEATNTDFYPYQFKPVLKLLHSPSNALLIADEVGLGKTIEAGLIWTELRSRFEMRRLLVLCPAVLREKWQAELSHKMGVKAEIVGAAEALKVLRDPASIEKGFALICSMQGLRPPRGWDKDEAEESANVELAHFLESKENEARLIDLLIVDEAHYFRNPETSTNELGSLLRNVSDYAVFLTATPVHNKNNDLFSLLNMLDSDTFQRSDDFANILEANRPLVQARDLSLSDGFCLERLREYLVKASVHPLLANSRQLKALIKTIDETDMQSFEARSRVAYRLETVNLLGHVVTRTRKRDVKEWRVVRNPVPESIKMSPVEEKFYQMVTAIVVEYSGLADTNHQFLLATPQRMMTSSMPAALHSWQSRAFDSDPQDEQELSRNAKARAHNLMGPLTETLALRAHELVSLEELEAEDSKYARLKEMLTCFCNDHPSEKLVLFSTFRPTLDYLSRRLGEDGISNIVLKGGGTVSKDEILRTFKDPGGPRALLSSEVGGEGVDLQFCRLLVNYDLPWNPMRVEQRIGRLDRIGQAAEQILIWNLFYEDTIDGRIYRRLYEKLDLCKLALGDFETILGEEIRRMTSDLLRDKLSPEDEIRRIDQTALALENIRLEQENLENSASQLVAYGDYILSQVQAARDLHRWITGEDLRAYVMDFFGLHYPGCSFHQKKSDEPFFEVSLSQRARHDLSEYIRKNRLYQPTRLMQTVSSSTRCRFENRVTGELRGHEEIISQFHPLVRFVSSQIHEKADQLRPSVAVTVDRSRLPGQFSPGIYVIGAAMWSVQGLQTTEKLVFEAWRWSPDRQRLERPEAEQLAVVSASCGADWYDAASTVDLAAVYDLANNDVFGGLSDDYESFVEEIAAQNADRISLQEATLSRHLDNQMNKLRQTRWAHEYAGRASLVKATEGRMKALEDRIGRQRLVIADRKKLTHRFEEILVALINVA